MMTAYKNDHSYDFQDFDDTDDISDDDEVFVHDSRITLDDENSVSKPLMPPRRKHKSNNLHTEVRQISPYRILWASLCYGLIAFGALIAIICLVIFLLNTFSVKFKLREEEQRHSTDDIVGCTRIEVEDVWVKNFPKLLTESAIRLNDVNLDGILDIIIGFATGADGYNVPPFVCDIYFDGIKPCFGGVLALDGGSGEELWRHYAQHEVFALNCNEDIDGDNVGDCLVGGRAGTFQAISGRTGKLLWDFGAQEAKNDIMNVYTAQFLPDQNGDGIVDVIAVHGGDPLAEPGSEYRLSGRIVIFSGKDGKVLRWAGVPDRKEAYYSPQRFIHPDGTELILFGTGGETHAGGFWYISLSDLFKGNMKKAKLIFEDSHKGIMTPPVITDVTGDGIADVIMATFNSTVVAFDGLNFKQIWNYSIPTSESYSTPAAGYFNNDDVPDFMIKYQIGPGFPIYYYSQTTVLDGVSGQPLLKSPILDTIGSQSSPLTIALEGKGNDIFIYWTSDCFGHEGESQEFTFVKGTNVHEQSRSNFCQLRFNSKMISRMYALNQHLKPPGIILYRSDERQAIEYNNSINTSAVAYKYLRTHPDMWELYEKYKKNNNVPEESQDANKPNRNRDREKLKPDTKNRMRGEKDFFYPKAHHDVTPERRKGFDNNEYEEVMGYPTVHNIRKHGHRKIPTRFSDDVDSHQADVNYLDDFTRDYGGGATDEDLGKVPWNGARERQWYKNFANDDEPSLESEDYRTSPYHKNRNYNYYKNGRKNFQREREQDFSVKDQDIDWNMGFDLQKRSKNMKGKRQTRPRRMRRHVGPHDNGGIQRLISTGALAPSLNASDANDTIDLVFANYWFFPAKTQAILPEDRDCIQLRMEKEKERFISNSPYYGMDHDAYERAIVQECLAMNHHSPSSNQTYQSQSDYDPFNIHMGQMTVYRIRLRCTCRGDARVELVGKRCARILPFNQQGWAAYMGSDASSHLRRRTT